MFFKIFSSVIDTHLHALETLFPHRIGKPQNMHFKGINHHFRRLKSLSTQFILDVPEQGKVTRSQMTAVRRIVHQFDILSVQILICSNSSVRARIVVMKNHCLRGFCPHCFEHFRQTNRRVSLRIHHLTLL